MATPLESDEPTGSWPRSWRGAVLAVYWVVLLVATHWPKVIETGLPVTPSDKAEHLVAFGILAWLLAWVLYAKQRLTLGRALTIVAIAAAYGLFDEFTQPWFGRTLDPMDMVADVVGASLGVGVYALHSRGDHQTQE